MKDKSKLFLTVALLISTVAVGCGPTPPPVNTHDVVTPKVGSNEWGAPLESLLENGGSITYEDARNFLKYYAHKAKPEALIEAAVQLLEKLPVGQFREAHRSMIEETMEFTGTEGLKNWNARLEEAVKKHSPELHQRLFERQL